MNECAMTYQRLKAMIKNVWGLSSKPVAYGRFADDDYEMDAEIIIGSTVIVIKPPYYSEQKTTTASVYFTKPKHKEITYSLDLPLTETRLKELAIQIMIDACKHR